MFFVLWIGSLFLLLLDLLGLVSLLVLLSRWCVIMIFINLFKLIVVSKLFIEVIFRLFKILLMFFGVILLIECLLSVWLSR